MFKETQIKETGIIKNINGNKTTIELLSQTTENCKSCSGCGEVKSSSQYLEVETVPGLEEGQFVVTQKTINSPYRSIMLVFVFPVISLLTGSYIGQNYNILRITSKDTRVIVCGFIFFITSLIIAGVYDKMTKNKTATSRKIISHNVQNSYDIIFK
ncbi:MAG: SoxR reducing system RseC family protein [Planctomycetes bacterium]|nr:SoxR reducing system RseC family protein [Planctomycetota bacterium]